MNARKLDPGDEVQRDIFDVAMGNVPSSGSVLVGALASLPGAPDPAWMAKPFLLTAASGKVWSVICDRAMVVAVQEAGPYEAAPDDPTPGRQDRLRSMIDMPVPEDAAVARVEALRQWAGPEGVVASPGADTEADGVLAGVFIDLRRLARVLALVPSRSLHVWNASNQIGVACVGMESLGKWRAFVAGVTVEDPSFPRKVFTP